MSKITDACFREVLRNGRGNNNITPCNYCYYYRVLMDTTVFLKNIHQGWSPHFFNHQIKTFLFTEIFLKLIPCSLFHYVIDLCLREDRQIFFLIHIFKKCKTLFIGTQYISLRSSIYAKAVTTWSYLVPVYTYTYLVCITGRYRN